MLKFTPFKHRGTNPEVELNSKRLKRWLENLPFEPANSIREIREALKVFNSQEISTRARLELLHIYRRKTNQFFEAYETTTFHQSIRGSKNRDRIKADIGRLTIELASGYKAIVTQEHGENANAHTDDLYRQAIYAAMEQTIFTLVHAFRIYGPLPHKAHHDLHQLYQLTEKHKALYLPVTLGNEPAPSETIGKLYKQFLLLSIVDPFHLGRGEALKVFRFLLRYTPSAEIVKETDCRSQNGLFAIDISADGPPVACKRSAPHPRPKDPRILDVSQVISAALRDKINADVSQQHRVLAQQGGRLMTQIISQFQGGKGRRETRNPVHWTTGIALGIESLHYFLCHPDQLTHTQDNPVEGMDVRTIDSDEEADYSLEPWSVIEESTRGYRLSCDHQVDYLQVGNIAGIVDNEDLRTSPRMLLGLIQWLRQETNGQVLVGVEKVPSMAVPVSCQPETEIHDGIPAKCLLLPGSREHRTATILMCPKNIFSPNQSVGIKREGKTIDVRLTELSLKTACVDGFAFSPRNK